MTHPALRVGAPDAAEEDLASMVPAVLIRAADLAEKKEDEILFSIYFLFLSFPQECNKNPGKVKRAWILSQIELRAVIPIWTLKTHLHFAFHPMSLIGGKKRIESV